MPEMALGQEFVMAADPNAIAYKLREWLTQGINVSHVGDRAQVETAR
jgi:hypothetical protein